MFAPKTKSELREAVKNYYNNKRYGISKYGLINSWDISLITDLSYLFCDLKYFR